MREESCWCQPPGSLIQSFLNVRNGLSKVDVRQSRFLKNLRFWFIDLIYQIAIRMTAFGQFPPNMPSPSVSTYGYFCWQSSCRQLFQNSSSTLVLLEYHYDKSAAPTDRWQNRWQPLIAKCGSVFFLVLPLFQLDSSDQATVHKWYDCASNQFLRKKYRCEYRCDL